MSWSFGFNITICLIAVIGAWLDHGETWTAFKSASDQQRRRKLAKLLVIWGTPLVSLIALPFTYGETIVSDKTAKETRRVATKALEKAAALAPQEQPITALSASVRIEARVTSTNVWLTDNGSAARSELRFEVFPQDHKQATGKILVADKFEQYGSSDGSVWYFVEFSRAFLPATLSQLPATLKVHDFDRLESLTIWAFFLPKGTGITGGRVLLTLNNSAIKEYEIRPKQLAPDDFPQIILCSVKNIRSDGGEGGHDAEGK